MKDILAFQKVKKKRKSNAAVFKAKENLIYKHYICKTFDIAVKETLMTS